MESSPMTPARPIAWQCRRLPGVRKHDYDYESYYYSLTTYVDDLAIATGP